MCSFSVESGPSEASASRSVLLIDDDPLVIHGVTRLLCRRGFEVLACEDLEGAVEWLRARNVVIVLLDYLLRECDGLQLCRTLRGMFDIPVIMLTGNASPELMVACLEAGADDYVTKPFHAEVLVSRMNAVLRRRGDVSHQAGSLKLRNVCSRVALDLGRGELRNEDRSVRLSQTEISVLSALLTAGGKPLSRDELSRRALMRPWRYGDRTVDVIVSRLRSKMRVLGAANDVRSVRNRGYALETSA